LLCCLAYESEHYAKVKEKLPKAGKVIDTPHGRGKVVQVNAVNESIQVELESQVRVEISYEELTAVEEKVETVSRRRRRRRREET